MKLPVWKTLPLRGSWASWAVAAALAFVATPAVAIPPTMTLEGTLASVGGGPVADGDYQVTLGLYAAEAGGQPVWSEGPLTVKVKSGAFSLLMGAKQPIDAAVVGDVTQLWLGLAIGQDPELPRKPMQSVPFAVRASVAAGVQCSGCISVGHLDPQVLAPYAKKTDLAGLAKTADLGAYALKSQLADVASTGAYKDLSGLPTLGKLASANSYADIPGLPVLAKVGASCGTGLVLAGIKADGSYDCVSGTVSAATLPKDGLNEVSNGLLFNQFNEVTASTKVPIAIADNYPLGVGDFIEVPDLGLAESLSVSAEITNSDTSTLQVLLVDPAGTKYTLWDQGPKGPAIKTSWPAPTKPVKGDLSTWVGKNPKGKWYLQVIDSGYLNNGNDGAIVNWSIDVQVLATSKVGVGGVLVLHNAGTPPIPCTASATGAVYFDTKLNAIRYCAKGAWRSLADNCGNGILDSGEVCDDGNLTDGDGCSALCTTVCGDGKKAGAEECDDGNTKSSDGCSDLCKLENPYATAKLSSGNKKLVFLYAPAGTTLNSHADYAAYCTQRGFDPNLNSSSQYQSVSTAYSTTSYYCGSHCCYLGSGNSMWGQASDFTNFGLPTNTTLRVFDRGCADYGGNYVTGLNTSDGLLVGGPNSLTYKTNHFGNSNYSQSKSTTLPDNGVIVCQLK